MRRRGEPARRRYRRITARVMVEYESDAGLRSDPATTLGAGGLFIATEEPLLPGQRLKLRFRLTPDAERFEIEGRVVWAHDPEAGPVHSHGMGIEFTDRGAIKRLAGALEVFRPAAAPQAKAEESG